MTNNFVSVYLRLSAVAVFALLAAGCADLHWHKPGTDAAALEQDLEKCRQSARLQARHETVPALGLASLPGSPSVIATDRQGRPVMGQLGPSEGDRFLREQDWLGACMRKMGYELKPADTPPGR